MEMLRSHHDAPYALCHAPYSKQVTYRQFTACFLDEQDIPRQIEVSRQNNLQWTSQENLLLSSVMR